MRLITITRYVRGGCIDLFVRVLMPIRSLKLGFLFILFGCLGQESA